MATEQELWDLQFETAKKVGGALKEIRDSRLFRETHESFESYIRDEWGMDIERANQVIATHENHLI